VGGSKPGGSRFQVETRKRKWKPIINISQNALFSQKNRGNSSQLTLFHSGGNFTSPSGIGLTESLPLLIFHIFSQPQEIVELSSWEVVNLVDPGFR